MGDGYTATTDMQCHGTPYPEGLAFQTGFSGF